MTLDRVASENGVFTRASEKLTYHGSWRGVSGLGLDLPPDHPAYTGKGVCYEGLGETEDATVCFDNLRKAFEYAVDGCTDSRGGVIYAVDPGEAKLQEIRKGRYNSCGRIPREHIRLVMIHEFGLDGTLEIASKAKEMLPNAEIVIYQYPHDSGFELPLKLWGLYL